MPGADRRFKVHLSTPKLDYWSEAIEAPTMYVALATWVRRVTQLPPDLRPGRGPGAPLGAADYLAAASPDWHLSVVPEESWPALEQELELLLGDSPF